MELGDHMGFIERAGLLAAYVLIVAGVAFLCWPVGLIVAGVLAGVAFWPDRPAKVAK